MNMYVSWILNIFQILHRYIFCQIRHHDFVFGTFIKYVDIEWNTKARVSRNKTVFILISMKWPTSRYPKMSMTSKSSTDKIVSFVIE